MKIESAYGESESPAMDIASGRSRCPFCKPKKTPKGDHVIELIVNSGPTGSVYYCMTHAKKLAQEILSLCDATTRTSSSGKKDSWCATYADHAWEDRGKCICPFKCKKCGALSGTDSAFQPCKPKSK